MKYSILIMVCFFGLNAKAGASFIICTGSQFKMESIGKGPMPYGPPILHIFDRELELQLLAKFQGSGTYDFQMIYQAPPPDSNLVATLQYVAGGHRFSVFKDSQLIETVVCGRHL